MNQLAQRQGFIVLYPQQTSHANGNRCWNWFRPNHQQRGAGEPARIVGIIQCMQKDVTRWTIDPRRIYVAGLSAGAAMSVILGATYPDVFAAIGVHSGLEYQAATTFLQAAKAMHRGGPDPLQQGSAAHSAMCEFARVVPTIVFYGTADRTVAPLNGEQVVQQWIQTNQLASATPTQFDYQQPSRTTTGAILKGYAYHTSVWHAPSEKPVLARWQIVGMGHAWSGGNPAGSYTDPRGPDASVAMYEFFIHHSLAGRDPQQFPLHTGLRQILDGILKWRK